MPKLEHQQPPKVTSIVTPRTTMLRYELPNCFLIKVAALASSRIADDLVEHDAQLIVQPILNGHIETLLWAFDNGVWNHSTRVFFETLYLNSASNLELARYRLRKFDQLVVQQRHSRFKRVRHAHSIYFCQDVAGQIGLAIQIHHAIQTVGHVWLHEKIFESIFCVVAFYQTLEVR